MRIRDWFRRSGSIDMSSHLPDVWESVQAFSVVIPFSETTMDRVELSLLEVVKIRAALKKACHAKYFYDEIYSDISAAMEQGENVDSDLVQYRENGDKNVDVLVAEKVHIILLNVDRQPLSSVVRSAINRIANEHSECDVIDFGGDPLVMNPRNGVLMYARGRRAHFVEVGSLVSEKQAAEILSKHAVRNRHNP